MVRVSVLNDALVSVRVMDAEWIGEMEGIRWGLVSGVISSGKRNGWSWE